MKKAFAKPGNMLYPLPAVMVGCAEEILPAGPDFRDPNIITIAWAGTVCSDPPMLSISVRPHRYSYDLLKKTGVFTVNLPDERLLKALDFCGVRSGRDTDKFAACDLTPVPGPLTGAPMIEESPVTLECRVSQIIPLGSHDLFLAEVLAVYADERYMDENGNFHLEDAHLVAYSHGKYRALGKILGTFGFSVKKKTRRRK